MFGAGAVRKNRLRESESCFYCKDLSQSVFTCAKSVMKKPEQCVKSVQS